MKAKSYLLLAASVFSLLSCAKEEQTQEITPEMSAPICVIAEAAGVATNKTHIDDYPGKNADGSWDLSERQVFNVFWDSNDECMYLAAYDVSHTFLDYRESVSYSLTNGGREATFAFDAMTKLTQGTEYLFVGISPATAVSEKNELTIPGTQNLKKRTFKGKDISSCYYDPKSALLVSRCKKTAYSTSTKVSLEYEKAAALNCISLKNMPEGVYKLEIEMKKGGQSVPLAGGRYFDLFTSSPGGMVSPQYKITLFCKDNSGNPAYFDANPDVWFNSWEVHLTAGDQLIVTAYTAHDVVKSGTHYPAAKLISTTTLSSDRSLYLEEGSMNHFTVNFDPSKVAVSSFPPVFTELASATYPICVGTAASGNLSVTEIFATDSDNNPFLPGIDKVRIRYYGDTDVMVENMEYSLYEVTPTKITIWTSTTRIGQKIQYYIYRGTSEKFEGGSTHPTSYNYREYFPVYDNYDAVEWTFQDRDHYGWVTVKNPETENPPRYYIREKALREQLKKNFGANDGYGVNATFDVGNMCTGHGSYSSTFHITGNESITSFQDMGALNIGSAIGDKTKVVEFRVWNNTNCTSCDLSHWNAAVTPYNYWRSDVPPSPITKVVLGPNMTGVLWLNDNRSGGNNAIQIIDCSPTKEMFYIQINNLINNLTLLDLRCHAGGSETKDDTYSRFVVSAQKAADTIKLSAITDGLNPSLSGLEIRVNWDVYDYAIKYQADNTMEECYRAWYLAKYLARAAQKGAIINVYGCDSTKEYDTFKFPWDPRNDGIPLM